jgi:hypothetical protein
MALPIPTLLPSEMFFDYTVGVLWIGTRANGNQQIPLSTLSGITFPDATVQTTAASGGPLNYKTARSIPTSFTQGGVVGPIAVSFATPFVDNNYTVEVTVLGDEVAPGTPTITQFPSVGVSYIAFQATLGAGVNVWIANNDSIAHTGIIHVIAIHD